VLAWLSVWSEVQTYIWPSWCHCHSLSLASVKSRLVLPFWYRLTRVVPDKGPLNGCVCSLYFRQCMWKKFTSFCLVLRNAHKRQLAFLPPGELFTMLYTILKLTHQGAPPGRGQSLMSTRMWWAEEWPWSYALTYAFRTEKSNLKVSSTPGKHFFPGLWTH